MLDKTAPLQDLPLIWPGMHLIDHNYGASSYSTTNAEKKTLSNILTNNFQKSSCDIFTVIIFYTEGNMLKRK